MCIGTYAFTRHIEDRYGGANHTASGILTITQTQWAENGKLHSLNESDFYQTYVLQFKGQALTVYYPNGHIFYALENFYGTHTIDHQCGKDIYLGKWIYTHTVLHLQWIVKGPQKDYTMHSIYTPNM